MIVGVSAKVVPILRGANSERLTRLWLPFGLINAGCALRVVGQTATDWAEWVFPLAGVSGVLEVLGLAVWGTHLAGLMLRRPGWQEAPALRDDRPIEAGDSVTGVLDRYPELLPVFLDFGFKPLANPVLRRAARGVAIQRACRFVGVDPVDFLTALNRKRPAPVRRTVSLPVLKGLTV
jgi:hypothetical protein